MKAEEVRYMWVFVFFDLPVGTKPQRNAATRFRNFLKDDGYLMLQFSVYARICRGEEAVDKHITRVTKTFQLREVCAHCRSPTNNMAA
jgi:CRISPR-associated protein Cas2